MHRKCPLNKFYKTIAPEAVEELEQDCKNQAFLDTLDIQQNELAKEILHKTEYMEN